MGKVLFPGYFPFSPEGEYCNLITGWYGLSLEMAMAAYWKVKSWQVSLQLAYPDEPAIVNKTITQTFSVTSPDFGNAVNTEEQLVCGGVRSWDFTIPEAPPDFTNAFSNAGFTVRDSGWDLNTDYTEFGELRFLDPSETAELILPITITIGGLTTELRVGGRNDLSTNPGSGSGSITAVELWPYSD